MALSKGADASSHSAVFPTAGDFSLGTPISFKLYELLSRWRKLNLSHEDFQARSVVGDVTLVCVCAYFFLQTKEPKSRSTLTGREESCNSARPLRSLGSCRQRPKP